MNRRPTTQDISWFLDLYNNDQLDLDPSYQRRSVWTRKDRTFFLDTIFRDYPCPAIFLHKSKDDSGKTVYHVVDGKQRLETIIAFVNNKIAIAKDFGDVKLDGKKWKDIEGIVELQNKLWDYVLTVEMVKTVEGTILKNVFDRLNRNSRKLERQELRHAKYDGWFISFCESQSERSEWREIKVVTTARARRMKDVQFISELLLIILEDSMVGFDQDYLDTKYAEYDDPAETHPDFNEESFSGFLERIIIYINEMENYNQCISTYATTFGHFYTLWSVVALNLKVLPAANVVADLYSPFMEIVHEISTHEDIKSLFESDIIEGEKYNNPGQYYQNAVGASTDLAQREGRYKALLKGLNITVE